MQRPVDPDTAWQGSLRKPVTLYRAGPQIDDEDFGSCDRLIVAKRSTPLADARIRLCDGRAWY